MKAPVGLLSGRAVCVSRWRGVAPTSSAERSKRIFTGGVVREQLLHTLASSPSQSLRASSPEGGALGITVQFSVSPEPLPLGEVARRKP